MNFLNTIKAVQFTTTVIRQMQKQGLAESHYLQILSGNIVKEFGGTIDEAITIIENVVENLSFSANK